MAYSDPQSIKIGADAAVPLPRTGFGPGSGEFTSSDGNKNLSILVAVGRRRRNSARLKISDIVSNPLVPSQNTPLTASFTFTADAPLNGYSNAQLEAAAKGLVDWLSAAGNLAKLIGNEV